MTIDRFFEGIGFYKDAAKTVVEKAKKIAPESFDLGRICELDYERALAVCCYLSVAAHEQYKERGISDRIYFDTFKDLTIWAKVCYDLYGVWGLKESAWLAQHIKLNLFRLGRLQFLPNETALTVHIPDDGRLYYEECVKSYSAAVDFFAGREPVFTCETWLLNENLKQLLSPDSNILRFAGDFTVTEGDPDNRQAEERVFNFRLQDDPSLYPQNTSLQRKLRQYLMDGGKMGTKFGTYYFK